MLATLAPRFSVQRTGRPRTVRRAWLDTFDWRLHRAGLTLEYVTGRGPPSWCSPARLATWSPSRPAG